MKTTIEFKNDEKEVHENLFPSVSMEDEEITLLDNEYNVIVDDILIEDVKRIIWEP